jgi:mycofactocin precursor
VALSSHRQAAGDLAPAIVVRIVDSAHRSSLLEVLMPETTTVVDTALDTTVAPAAEEALVEESLVEEVSIDGMCGVY